MKMLILLHLSLYMLKHTVGDFANSLRFSGWPQAAYQSLKAHWRCQLLRMPQVIMVDLNVLWDAANS